MKKRTKIIIFIILFIIFLFFVISRYIYDNTAIDKGENINLKSYLGIEYNKLSKDNIKKLNTEIKDINNMKLTNKNVEDFNDKIDNLNKKIKSMGINLPYLTFNDYLKDNKSKINEKDYTTLVKLTDEIDSLQDKIDAINNSSKIKELNDYEDELTELNNKRGQILIKNKLDPYDIKNQIEDKTSNYITIPVDNGILNTSNIKNKEDILIYNNIWTEINKIIPKNYIGYINKLQIFTDGKDNTLAYMLSDNPESSKWMISVDLIDSLNYKGEFTKDFTDTLIHEFMHLITLNNTQLADKVYEFGETYTIDEGSLKKDSYLNLFYEKFWSKYTDYINKMNRSSISDDDKLEMTSEFYNKHKNDFVSEYAATNPAEDIAETFMTFVITNKPTGNSIRDQKINFMYQFKELVDIRNFIRNNLNN